MKIMRLLCRITALSATLGAFAQSPPAAPVPCQESEQKQLDFWVGEWDLTWTGQKPGEINHGTNNVKRVMDGCVVEENFSGGSDSHLRGHSVSMFDARARMWKQTWVDNEGSYLDFIGGLKDGQMSFWMEVNRHDGSPAIQRMIWKNVTADSLDWSWESSVDAGKTWQVMWPIHYQRKK
jgi:hypothetical protein